MKALVIVAILATATIEAKQFIPAPPERTSQNTRPPQSFGQNNAPPPESDPWIGSGATGSNPARSVDDLDQMAHSSWFALSTGLASILGLLVTLYSTQVSALPSSLYRSLMSRKVLLEALGGGILVWASIRFYNQDAPSFPPFQTFYALLHGGVETAEDGTSVWVLLMLTSLVVLIVAKWTDPLQTVRNTALWEERTLAKAKKQELRELFGDSKYEDLSELGKKQYEEVIAFYSDIQSRLIEVLLGPVSVPRLRASANPRKEAVAARHGFD